MKQLAITSFLITLITFSASAQSASLGDMIDSLTTSWNQKSIEINSYAGLKQFCEDTDYRQEVIELVSQIHNTDSVLYQKLVKAYRMSKDQEIEKTLHEIQEFEKEYSMKKFIHFLHNECRSRKDIERNAEELKSEIGSESYSGQIYILENELNKFIKHITKTMNHIQKHAHHLHVQ